MQVCPQYSVDIMNEHIFGLKIITTSLINLYAFSGEET